MDIQENIDILDTAGVLNNGGFIIRTAARRC